MSLLTKVMQVDRRSYYRWLAMQANKLKISPSQVKRNRDKASVKHLFEAEKGKIGSRSIVAILRSKGHEIGRYRVRSIMRSLGLVCRIRKAYKGNYKKATQALIFNKHEIAKAQM